jgi:hypothetical protein
MFGFAGGQNCTSLFDYLVFSVAILWLILGLFFLLPRNVSNQFHT